MPQVQGKFAKSRVRLSVIACMILVAAVLRIIPHPPNFAPIGAMALFGGACFVQKRWAFGMPLAAMFLSDLVLGLHPLAPVVYGSFALSVCLGCLLRTRRGAGPIAAATLAGSILFFICTNFGVWALGSWYPKTVEGLFACYVAAIPFFPHTLLGDMVYATVLFGSLALAERGLPALHDPAVAVSR